MKFLVSMVCAVLAFAAPLQAQLKVAERDSILRVGPLLRNPCDRSQDPQVNPQARKCFWDYTSDSTKHAQKYERAAYELQKAHEDFLEWCAKNDAKCREQYPGKFATSNKPPVPASPNNGIDGGLTESQLASIGRDTGSVNALAFTDVEIGASTITSTPTTPTPTPSSSDSTDAQKDSARRARLSADSARMRAAIEAKRKLRQNDAARDRAQYLASMQILGPREDPNGHAFSRLYMPPREKLYEAMQGCGRGEQPSSLRIECAKLMKRMNEFGTRELKGRTFRSFDEIELYFQGLTERVCKKGVRVWLDRLLHSEVDDHWNRECKKGDVILIDNQMNVAVIMLSCWNLFSRQPDLSEESGILEPVGGPRNEEDRFDRGEKGQRGNHHNPGVSYHRGSNTGWWIAGGLATAAVTTGVILCAKNHCLGGNDNNNQNNNQNDNTVRTQKTPGINVPVGFILKILR